MLAYRKALLPGIFNNPRLADHCDFNLAWVLEFLFYFEGNVAGHYFGFGVGDFFWRDEDADFAAGLDGVNLFHALERAGQFFQFR